MQEESYSWTRMQETMDLQVMDFCGLVYLEDRVT